MPTPWLSASAHIGQASRCSSRQVRGPIRCRSALVTATTSSRSSGDGAEAQPERLVGRADRHERLPPGDVDVLVDHRGDDVRAEQHEREQREVAVQGLGDEPGYAARRAAAGREQRRAPAVRLSRTSVTAPLPRLRYQRNGPSIIRPPSRPWRPAASAPTGRTRPSAPTSRAVTPRWASQGSASAPSTTAAVLAVLAATHVGPVAVTVRQYGVTGRPVRGSSRWCRTTPPRRQRRTVVLEVASPPEVSSTTHSGRTCASAGCSAIATLHGPAVRGGDPQVTAQADQGRPAELLLERGGDEVGGPGLRRRAEVERGAGGDAQPVLGPPDRPPRVRVRRGRLGLAAYVVVADLPRSRS